MTIRDASPRLPTTADAAALEPLMDVGEVAAILRASPRHVRRLIASGALRVTRIGRLVRVSPNAVRALINNSK